MNLKHLVFGALMAAGAMLWPSQARAVPVIDAEVLEALEQMETSEGFRFWYFEFPTDVQELNNSYTEVDNSTQELALSQEEKEATTGPRGMSALARTPESYIPLNWQETLALMEEPGSGLGGLAEQIRQRASKLDEAYFANVDPALKADLDREMRGAAAGIAMNATVYDASEMRQEKLNELADRIEEAEDPKAIWDLQARIGVENGMLLNELIRLQSVNAMVENQHRLNAQQTTQQGFSLTDAKY